MLRRRPAQGKANSCSRHPQAPPPRFKRASADFIRFGVYWNCLAGGTEYRSRGDLCFSEGRTMKYLISDDVRRNPYPLYEQLRSASPLLQDPTSGLWMIFDYDGVYRALTEHESFS